MSCAVPARDEIPFANFTVEPTPAVLDIYITWKKLKIAEGNRM